MIFESFKKWLAPGCIVLGMAAAVAGNLPAAEPATDSIGERIAAVRERLSEIDAPAPDSAGGDPEAAMTQHGAWCNYWNNWGNWNNWSNWRNWANHWSNWCNY